MKSFLKHSSVNYSTYKIPKIIEIEIPNKIVASYITDYNIIELHTKIMKTFGANNDKKNIYMGDIKGLIDEYTNISKQPQIITFGATITKKESLTKEQIERRHNIIDEYLKIAKKYVDIDIRRQFPINNLCPVCDYSMEDVYVDDNGLLCCPECGFEKMTYSNTSSFSGNSTNSGGGSKKDYEDRKNFLAALMKYQCKQLTRFPQIELFKTLDEYFRRKGIITRDEIKEQTLNENGTRGITTRNMLLTALHDTGYADYYVDCSLIGQLYWDWKPPDVSHLEDIIMELYDITQTAFHSLKGLDRESSINLQFRLYKLLMLVGHKCQPSDFKLIRTAEILENLETIWKQICEITEIPYIPTNS